MATICAVIARRRHRKILEEAAEAVAKGIELLEIRLDFVPQPKIRDLVERRLCPMIATVRRRQDGGQWSGRESDRLSLLRNAIAEGFDYVDLEVDVAKQIPRYGATKRIVSYHNLAGMPESLAELYEDMRGCDPDIIKIACRVNDPSEMFPLLLLMRDADIPTIALAVGELGTASRVLGAKFGTPFTYAAFNNERIVAPGMLTYTELAELYRYPRINKDTEVYGVIGDPIEHSLSPLVHNACFQALGFDKVYLPFRVPRDCLDRFLTQMPPGLVSGLSVTIPHKEAVLKYGKTQDALVELSGSANTMIYDEEGWRLANTDGPAAIDSLNRALSARSSNGRQEVEDRIVLILGSGGVARTIAHSLRQSGAIVSITNRNADRATELARQVDCKTAEWTNRHAIPTDILINCTPVGMHPDVGKTPFLSNGFRENMVVFDTIYNPEYTTLLREASKRGCIPVTGVDMFVGQAEAQFQIFTGSKPPQGLMATLVREELSPARNMLREVRLNTGQSVV